MVGQQSEDPHRLHPGNRPSSTLLLDALTPHTLGMVVALYEHKVFVQSVIWEINPFDQFGVELGKKIATQLHQHLIGEGEAGEYDGYDSSTRGLLQRIEQRGKQR
jgi:glucose-6-phosphate isomerase